MPQQIPGNQDIVVGNNDSLTVTGDRTVHVGRNHLTTVVANASHKVEKALLIQAKNVTVRGTDSLTLVCGSASIVMKKDGTIDIKGKDITIDGTGKINVKASSDVVIKGSKITQN